MENGTSLALVVSSTIAPELTSVLDFYPYWTFNDSNNNNNSLEMCGNSTCPVNEPGNGSDAIFFYQVRVCFVSLHVCNVYMETVVMSGLTTLKA